MRVAITMTMIGCAAAALAAASALTAAAGEDNVPAAKDERIILNAPKVTTTPHTHRIDLHVTKTRATLYNPASGRDEAVYLRSYVARTRPGEPAPAGLVDTSPTPFVAPTIEAKPGDTLEIMLHNDLDDRKPCEHEGNMNVPHCFDNTNLHTHGLWVSPQEDDVLLDLNPGKPHDYVYHIPPEHPAGTLWYHPHKHGSTALQVGSGMAGALIIRGNRKPTATKPGDIDTLLAPLGVKERVLLFQQIQYACFNNDKDKTLKTNDDGTWRCDKGDVGTVDDYRYLGFNGPKETEQWTLSGRFTSINGEILPVFEDARAGRVERWRMIDSGLVNTIGVQIVGLTAPPDDHDYDHLNAEKNAKWLAQYCRGDVVHQFAFAADGVTRDAIVDRGVENGTDGAVRPKPSILQPGYREDVLVVFPHTGRYCVIDSTAASPPPGQPVAAAALTASISQEADRPQLLGIVEVRAGEDIKTSQQEFMLAALVKAAGDAHYAGDVAAAVMRDLQQGMKITKFAPHQDLRTATNVGTQQLSFDIVPQDKGPALFLVGQSVKDKSSEKPFDPMHTDRWLQLGQIDEWTLTSNAAAHPFHIHVNPFQIVAIFDANHKDVSVTGELDEKGNVIDSQYADLQGVWKDTIFVKPGYQIVMRTKYERFTGTFVLHCHILDHEDQGMMEKIEILGPGATPKTPAGKSGPMHM